MTSSLRTQLFRFVVVGVIATVVDAGLYFAAVRLLAWPYDLAKGASFLFGTTTSFLLNRSWTFEVPHADSATTRRFVTLYAATFLLNVGANRLALNLLFPLGWSNDVVEPFAIVFATAWSTIANFIGQRAWVFAPRAAPPPSGR